MPVDYSKWDALELSDDSDIEVHPNVDKRSFIRAKQNQIHQERLHRKHEIETLKYERIINDGLLTRIDALLAALKSHAASASSTNPDQLVFQSLIESAGDPAHDQPPPAPEGVHVNIETQPTYSKMMASLVDQVKKTVDEKKPDDRLDGFAKEVNVHKDKVLSLQQELLKRLAELEKLEGAKITSESISYGFNSSHVAKDAPATKENKVELLNPDKPQRPSVSNKDAVDDGSEADVEDESSETVFKGGRTIHPSSLGKAFGKLPVADYRAYLEFISKNPTVLAEKETDGLLMEAFDRQLEGKEANSKQCVHQALLLQYCRSLGKDGVAMFFKRITTPEHQARKMFFDDVNSTYARLKERAKAMANEEQDDEGDDGAGVEQIQLHAVDPGSKILIQIPDKSKPEDAESMKIFEAFPPGLQRALETGSLDEVNKVLGKMSVDEAEVIVEQLSEGGMLSMEQGIVDATTEEGKAQMEEIERMGRMSKDPGPVEETVDEAQHKNLVDELD